MINEDDVLTSSGLFDTSSLSRYLLNDNNTDTDSVGRPYSSPLYNSGYVIDEEDPWGGIETFQPSTNIRQQQLTSINSPPGPIVTTAVDSDTVTEGMTSASALVGVSLPEVFDAAYIWTNPAGDRIDLDALESVLHLTGLPPHVLEKIIALVVSSNTERVTRNEFNTALALTAFAQKNMELSLLNVYQHRNGNETSTLPSPGHMYSLFTFYLPVLPDLPVPILPGLNSGTVSRNKSSTLVTKDKKSWAKVDHNTVVDDPWRTITPIPSVEYMGSLIDGKPIIQSNGAAKQQQQHAPMDSIAPSSSHDEISSVATAGDPISEPKTTLKMDIGDWYTDIDNIKITAAPEKEGFLFKHINYIVESQPRTSLVVRRYSDFYWLWEVLLRRYPCRLVPIIPPKKIGGRSDDSFLETRRQGLARFINGIARHPVLRNDTCFDTFMAEPSEFSMWRRANSPDLDEEFVRVNADLIPDALSAYIPRDLNDRLEQMEKTLHERIDHYLLLYHGMEAMAQVGRAQKAELERYGSTLSDMGLVERECFIPGCQACSRMVTQGFDSVANYMRKAGSILDREASDTVSGVMDRLKQHCDTLMAFKDVLERRKKLQIHLMDGILKRISSNKAKANQSRGVPGLERDVEALDTVIQADQEQYAFQQRRALFIRYCLTCELTLVHKQQAFVSVLYQSYVSEKVHYTRQKVDNWKSLEALTCSMPELHDFE